MMLPTRYIMKKKYISYFNNSKKELSNVSIDPRTMANVLAGNSTNKKTAYTIANELKTELLELFLPQNEKATLSSQTIMHHYRLLNTILNTAVEWNLLLNNPAERIRRPRVEQRETLSLDDDEVAEMLTLLESAPLKYQAAVYIAVFGGLRLGEVVALKWSDIEFQSGKLSVTKARQYISGIGNFEKAPKTESSKRELKLPKKAIAKLAELQKEQFIQRSELGRLWVGNNNVFTQWDGSPISPDTISHWFTKWISKTELPQITFHGLRHSSASILIAHGTDIVTVSKRLGHSKTSTTTDIYSHAIKKMDEAAAETLDSIFKIS